MLAMAASLSFGRDRDLGLPERAPADQLLERMIELSLGSVALRGDAVQFERLRDAQMTKPIVRDPIYRRHRFDAEVIELCVRWYITYRLSYRDLVAMMAERGISVSHTTIHRWVIRYVPEFEKRWNRFARPVNTSWRVDETYINIRGEVAFSLSGCRQARQDCGFSASSGSQYRRCASLLSQSSVDNFTAMATQDNARWPQAEPPGPSASAAGGSEVDVRSGEEEPIPQQPH
jgi:hypothetical protein